MSEESKMGLFGSKDDTKEPPSDDTDKPDTPNNFAPYFIDSDSETYDTEALSIMDINDIIGVQTGQAVESTLESEIAALTEIITDSKGETNSDTMNEIHDESSDIKFNEELLTEFASVSSIGNFVATTSKDGLDTQLTTSESGIGKNQGEVTIKNEDVVFSLDDKLGQTKIDLGSKDKAEDGSSLFTAVTSFHDITRNVVLDSEEDRLVKVDGNSENETINKSSIQGDTNFLEGTLETAKVSLDNDGKDANKDSPKGKDVPIVSSEVIAEFNANLVDTVDSVGRTILGEKEGVDVPADKTSADVLTNLGSTSKSLQLIGEAYISEDSQENDENDAKPVVKDVSFSLDEIKEPEMVEKGDGQLRQGSPGNVLTGPPSNEPKINVAADILESTAATCGLSNQDSTSFEDNNKSDNVKEAPLNLQDNDENRSQGLSTEVQTNIRRKSSRVVEEDHSVEQSLLANDRKEFVEVTSSSKDETIAASDLNVKISNTKTEIASEMDNFASEPLTSTVSETQIVDTNVTELKETHPDINEQNLVTSSESNITNEFVDSHSNEKSLLSLQHSIIEPVHVDKNSEYQSVQDIISAEKQGEEISDNDEQLPDTDIPLNQKDEVSRIHEENLYTDAKSQLISMEINSPITEEIRIASNDNTPITKGDSTIEKDTEKIDDTKNVKTEFRGINSPAVDVMEAGNQDTTSYDGKKLSSIITEADSSSSEILDKNFVVQKDNLPEIETAKVSATKESAIKTEGNLQNAPESENLYSITKKVVSESTTETALKNIESNLNKEDLNETEKITLSSEAQEICEPEKADSEKRTGLSGSDEEKSSEAQVCDRTPHYEENEASSESSSSDADNKQEDTSNKGSIEIAKNKSIIEPELSSMEDPFDRNNDSQSQPQQVLNEDISKIQHKSDDHDASVIRQEQDYQSEFTRRLDGTQYQSPSPSNSETSCAVLKPDSKSEISSIVRVDDKKDDSEVQLQQSGNDNNVPSITDKSSKNLSEDQVDKTYDAQIEVRQLPAALGVSENVKLSDKEQKHSLTKSVAYDNSDDGNNIHSLEETLEFSRTQSNENLVVSKTIPIALHPDNPIEPIEKLDENLQCEPVGELEKLRVVAGGILFDELADSALKDTAQPLENIHNLQILPDTNLSVSTIVSSDELKSKAPMNETSGNKTCIIEDLNQTPSVSHDSHYITDVIVSSTNIDNVQFTDNIEDMGENVTGVEVDDRNQENVAEKEKGSENVVSQHDASVNQCITNISKVCELEIEGNLESEKNIEINLPLKPQDEKSVESAVLRECHDKIDLPDEVLFDAENPEQTHILCDTPVYNADTSQQSSEFSELECAVKFLQESEEQTLDSPLLLSPKITEEIVEDNSNQSKPCLFMSETEVCQETLGLPVELEEIIPDPIAISEAEIISEAAKLENERKLNIAAEISKTSMSLEKSDDTESKVSESNSEMLKTLLTTSVPNWQKSSGENIVASTSEVSKNTEIPKLPENIIRRSEKIPKISILEERLKEPPKIEIPVSEISPKLSDTPTTPKTSLLIQRDSRIDTRYMYQKMLESPKGGDKIEPKIADTPRKDSDKHDFENVGSPRIILKIAKSAIADCGEPRSPKSPKIRSAANSPNPEDSPGQKLGKIKLKLSKGGHPSIISNDNFGETSPRHTEATLSPSHIGMKIKLSKTGDASIIQPEKHDSMDDIRENKHKYGESSPKRIDSPLGMKIKLSKTGDPSIVQHESKDSGSKRKDKLDIGQEIPKRTDSPIGMKIKLSKSGDASIIQRETQETFENVAYTEIPKRTESPIGMKIKLSKTGDASIISSECCEEFKDSPPRSRDKLNTNQDIPKRTDSPLGMKFKLSKSGGASIIQPDKSEASDDFKDRTEFTTDVSKRVDSPIGMKIKLSKTGDASIIHPERQKSEEPRESITMKHREKSDTHEIQKRTDSPLGMRIKVTKTGEASVVHQEEFEGFDMIHEIPKRTDSPLGMKIKLSKSGDASIIHPEKQDFSDESKDCAASSKASSSTLHDGSKSSESSFGMKIKLSKTGDASIIHPEISPESRDSQLKRTEILHSPGESTKRTDSPLGMKIKLSKTGDASIIEPDKKERITTKQKEKLTNLPEASQKRKETEYPLEMKIKLSKTGHPTIVANEKQESFAEMHSKSKDHCESGQSSPHKHTESTSPAKDSQLRIFKSGHSTIIQSSRSEVTIEPIQLQQDQAENSMDISPKCKDVVISPVELRKSKVEAKLSHILPEVTIQPITSGEQKEIMLDKTSSTISRQQMSVINQEISITHVSPSKPPDLSMSGKLKEILRKNATNSPANSDCEIIEHRPELIIVNENSNSSQDIMIIEEVKPLPPEVKIPRKRGRPKRSTLPPAQLLIRPVVPEDPLALDNMQSSTAAEHKESDRPKRTCRNQKSYAPPKRGRGRGRGKRKMDRLDSAVGKIPRLEDPLTAIERSTMSLIDPVQPRLLPEETAQTSELYKALKRSPAERKRLISENLAKQGFPEVHKKAKVDAEPGRPSGADLPLISTPEHLVPITNVHTSDSKALMISELLQLAEPAAAQQSGEEMLAATKPEVQETKDIITDMTTTEHQNWLTPSIKLPETTGKTEAISMVQVMDEETRMSAESNSRSQTPARNISIPTVETAINEESQGSVLSTATTESEKVKVRNRRMEINFDPDEGPFTVEKIAEYEWPLDKKGDTFMIQEQISQYLGVKSFKRKYPDLKRRMVEMEERNYLRENCLVSEAMCDMGLTAICSSEVLDIMCSDFPDQYEEYRKHMREKQAKEHSKKQKELTAAANAERNRIDLAEMAVQSALSWNVNFNKARKECRKYSLDLQSLTIHVPKKQLKVDTERKASDYPVALIPGQYTDYYREYTPAELRYYPLNTVVYGPMRPNERKFDSQSEGSQSDSDSDSSSDDSSSSSSEGTQDTEESQSTIDEVDMEISSHKEDNKNLKCKMCLRHLNKHGKAEVLIQCGTCNGNVHPSCIDLTLDMVPHIQGYSWQCTDCKTCVQCHNPADEDKMLFCDMCDRGYHIYCVGLRRVPQGRWHCRECAVCASCGLRQPGGANSDRNSVAQWQHEYKKGERNTRVYVSTLCVPCSKLWRKGRYCPHCSCCHSAQRLDLEPNLIHCGACDKYLHLGCVEIRSGTLDRKNYICDWCSTPGQQISRSLISKNFKS